MRRLVLPLLLLVPSLAHAHPFDLSSLELSAQDDVVQAQFECALPVALEAAQVPPGADLSPQGLTALVPALFSATLASGALTAEGQPCRWGTPDATVDGIRIRIRAAARCAVPPGLLQLSLPFVQERPPTFRILGVARLGERRLEFQAGPGRQVVALEGPPPSASHALLQGLTLPLRSPLCRLALLLLLALPLGTATREAALAVVAGMAALAAGWLAGRLGLGFSPGVLEGAAALVVALALVEPALGRPSSAARFRFGLGGVVLGVGLEDPGSAAARAGVLALLGLAAGVALLLPLRTVRRAQVGAGVVALLTVVALVAPR